MYKSKVYRVSYFALVWKFIAIKSMKLDKNYSGGKELQKVCRVIVYFEVSKAFL